MYTHLKRHSAKAPNSTPGCFKLPSTLLFPFGLGGGLCLCFGPLFCCLHKNLLWLSDGKGSVCNHQSPWGRRQTLMALPKLGQSRLPTLGDWKVVKRLEKYWKSALHNIAFLSSCSQPLLVCSLPAKLPLPARGFLLGSPVTIHTWQLVPWGGFSVPRWVISRCFLGPSFCSMPGSCLELQIHSAVSGSRECLFLFFPFDSISLFGNYLQLLACRSHR